MTEQEHSPKAQLAERGLHAKKHFGQNFLTDPSLARRIAELASTPPGGTVVELGAGLGALTGPLLERAAHVVAIERDRDLIPMLEQRFARTVAEGKLQIIEADAKGIDPVELCGAHPRPHVLAGNLPYNLTGPLLTLATSVAQRLERVVYLVQLEVADRVAARPGTDAYGALSVFVQAQFAPRRALVVRRGAFYPQPNVDSAVLVLEPLPTPVTAETEAFRAVVRAAFAQRRKKLTNAWRGVLGQSAAAVCAAAERAHIDLNLRGEVLAVTDFATMARELVQ
jgi:16S rRNA (adenine1518-N6/adenine1519-N6)-dimethyltransferase